MQNRTLYFGDNLEILREKIPDATFDLIYLDPPFNSNRNYNVIFKEGLQDSPAQVHAFEDSWHWTRETQETFEELVGVRPSKIKINQDITNLMSALEKLLGHNDVLAYLTMMAVRLIELKRVLKSTGSIYLHCDPTSSHYLKIVMDAIFGKQNFQNEIIWHYRRWTGSANKFLGMHDDILFYTKSPKDYIFNPLFTAYTEKSLKRKENYHTRIKGDDVYITSVNEQGVKENDVWNMPVINSQAKERLGYPTQKPEALLERIIKASSNEGDLVLDPFCGCGTTVSVAERLNRNWVGIDITMLAINLIKRRLIKQFEGHGKKLAIHTDGIPKDIAGAMAMFKKDPFDFEYWALDLVNAVPAQNKTKENMRGADKGIDGVINFVKDKENGNYIYGKILVQIKGGSVHRDQIATLKGDIERERADGGLFITLEKPTKPMAEEAVSSGTYEVKFSNKKYPKIQILTIDDLLNGEVADTPPSIPYNKEATVAEVKDKTKKLL
ncbi:MAG: DNA methyltransferase [Candidatus Staskawiczbacteria bacterium]|nr:DNA methyltransferase [Candidatus Staskawiczbacteria bacterium]